MPRRDETQLPAHPEVRLLMQALHGAAVKGWQGPALLGALRGITAVQARWSPAPGRKSIWEHTLHAVYWKHIVRRQIDPSEAQASRDAGAQRAGFPRSPSNWPRVPDLDGRALERAWTEDRALLKQQHLILLETVRRLDPATLHRIPKGLKQWTVAQRVLGSAAHDAYHLGQIQLLKRQYGQRAG